MFLEDSTNHSDGLDNINPYILDNKEEEDTQDMITTL